MALIHDLIGILLYNLARFIKMTTFFFSSHLLQYFYIANNVSRELTLSLSLMPLTLIDLTLSNAKRFYSSMGNPFESERVNRQWDMVAYYKLTKHLYLQVHWCHYQALSLVSVLFLPFH